MLNRMRLIATVKRFLRRRGILIDRYSFGTSPHLRLVQMLIANGIDLVLDVGANDGGYATTIREAGYCGKILSFEALSSAHARLAAATAHDRLWEAAPRMAIGEDNGAVLINIAGNSASSSILPMTDNHRSAAPASAYVGSEPVTVERLDGVRHPFLNGAVSPFLKIDTQGYENQVLAGAVGLLPRLRGVQVEMSLLPLYENQGLWRATIAALERDGFDLWALVPGFFDPRCGRMLQCDGIFFRA